MKKTVLTLAFIAASLVLSFAQVPSGDYVGKYISRQGEDVYKVEITSNADGSLKAQIFWVRDCVDPKTGQKYLDKKNPDKSLRNTPCDRIVLFDGARFNPGSKRWEGTKIYDPQRGIKAKLTMWKNPDGTLSVKGTLLGISETVLWKPVNE